MPKSKQFAKPSKKAKGKAKAELKAPSDFQEAADYEEETGGKWRAGDPAKSGRAFVRALEIYDKGLERHPTNFDLAYNKARLQLEITQQALLVAHIGLPLVDLLKQTLDSHRYALRIDSANPDALFNTSQVLTTLAENLIEGGANDDAVHLLHEALELLSSCLSRQEIMIEQELADAARFNEQFEAEHDGGVPLTVEQPTTLSTNESMDEEEGESATIEMPVTASDILDTAHASIATLTTLISLVDPTALSNLGEMAQSLLVRKVPAYILQLPPEEQKSALLANKLDQAVFAAAFGDAQYQHQLIDLTTYVSLLSAFDFTDKSTDVIALSEEGEARQEFTTTVLSMYRDSPDLPAAICWRQLTLAQEAFSKAARIDGSVQIYLARGDVELYRHRIATNSQVPLSDAIRKSAPTLVQNAQTYFRSAGKLSDGEGDDMKIKIEARFALATALRKSLYQVDPPDEALSYKSMYENLSEFVEDGLVDSSLANLLA